MGMSSQSQVQAMDNEGLDKAILFPTRGLMVMFMEGLEAPLAGRTERLSGAR